MMDNKTETAIRDHAQAEYPRECCGLVAIIKGKERYLPCRNEAETPLEHFVLSAEDYAKAEDMGEIVAVVHSHPDALAIASEADKVACESSGLPWHIVAVAVPDGAQEPVAGEIVTIAPSGYEAPLVGRTFVHGVLDCYSIIRGWYARERGIELPNFERRDGWWNDGSSNLYLDHFEAAGFQPIKGAIQVGDIVLMQIRSENHVPNHAAVYIGDGQIIHHMHGRLSSRDVYDGWFQEVTRLVIRRASA